MLKYSNLQKNEGGILKRANGQYKDYLFGQLTRSLQLWGTSRCPKFSLSFLTVQFHPLLGKTLWPLRSPPCFHHSHCLSGKIRQLIQIVEKAKIKTPGQGQVRAFPPALFHPWNNIIFCFVRQSHTISSLPDVAVVGTLSPRCASSCCKRIVLDSELQNHLFISLIVFLFPILCFLLPLVRFLWSISWIQSDNSPSAGWSSRGGATSGRQRPAGYRGPRRPQQAGEVWWWGCSAARRLRPPL